MNARREYTEMLLLEATGLADEADRPRTPDPGDPALSSKRCWERAKIEWSVEINNVIAAARERDLEMNLMCDASTRSDATLVSYLYRGKQTRQRLRHLRPPVMATVDEDDNPRHNDDWKWEQHSGNLHAPERPSGFQGPEIFTARCHVAD